MGPKPTKDSLWLWETSEARTAQRVLPLLQGASRMLDLGCGPGIASAFFAAHTPKVVATDRGRRPVAYDGPFVRADSTRLPFKAASFDLIWCAHMLEHVLCPGLILQEIHRALRTGGWLVLLTPRVSNDPVNRTYLTDMGHMWDFSNPACLSLLLARIGFDGNRAQTWTELYSSVIIAPKTEHRPLQEDAVKNPLVPEQWKEYHLPDNEITWRLRCVQEEIGEEN